MHLIAGVYQYPMVAISAITPLKTVFETAVMLPTGHGRADFYCTHNYLLLDVTVCFAFPVYVCNRIYQ